MTRISTGCLWTVIALWWGESLLLAVPADRQSQPGRQVKVAAIAIECGGQHEPEAETGD